VNYGEKQMKKNNPPHWILREIAERRAPRSGIDLWPQIEMRPESSLKERRLKIVAQRYRSAYILAAAALILMAAITIAVPQARASIKEVFQRMGMEFVQPDPGPQGAVASVESIRGTPPPSMTLEEIQELFPYMLLAPAWLPGDLALSHAGISWSLSEENPTGSPCVRLAYREAETPTDDQRYLSFQVSPGECGGPFLLPVTKEQAVEVNGVPGSFVQGGWRSDGKGDPETTYAHLQWDDSLGDAYLAWRQEGLNYFIAAFNLGLTREDMIRVAESIREP
jgi:hypothetical protein